jgi:hypothetical protein
MIRLILKAVVSLVLSMPSDGMAHCPEYRSVHLPVSGQGDARLIPQSDSVKKQPPNRRAKPVRAVKQPSETHYSAPGHYTVTVPRDNTPDGKADLILVNGTRPVDRISDVDSNTIESIELLKDSKSIAKYRLLYGDKAAKGIVIIHLKGTKTL